MSIKHLSTITFLLLCHVLCAQNNNDTIAIKETKNAINSKITYTANDSIITDIKDKKVYLFNNANIQYEEIQLQAGFIEINWQTNTLYATGILDSIGKISQKPIFTESGQDYKADTITYNFKSKKGLIKKVITKEGEGYLHGEKVKKIDEKDFFILKGGFTTCDNEDPHFLINSKKIKVVNGERVISGPAFLEIANIPTPLVLPFGIFPNQNKQISGIVFPSYGESANRGFFLMDGGYHFAFNDKINLTLKGDIYSHGGWGLKAISNYKKRYKYNGGLTINYSKIKLSEEHLPDYSITNDFFITWNHYQDAKARPHSIFSADVNLGTSTFLQNNATTSDDVLTNTLTSNISYSKSWAGKPFNFSLNFRHSQNTQTKEIDVSLPELAFSVSRFYPFERKKSVGNQKWYEKIGISYTLNGKNQISTYDSLLFSNKIFQEFNNGFKHYIPISTNIKLFKYISLNPSLNYTEYWYFNSTNLNWNYNTNSEESDTLWGFKSGRDFNMNAQFTTKLYGTYQFNRKNLKAIRHVLTPSINFTYRPDFSTDFWGTYSYYNQPVDSDIRPAPTEPYLYSTLQNGLYGNPPQGILGTVSFSFINSLEAKVSSEEDTINNTKNISLLDDFSFSSSYNMAANEFKWSPFYFSGRTNFLNNKLALTFSGNLDPYAIDETGNRINEYNWNKTHKLFRLTSSSLALSIDFQNTFGNKKSDLVSEEELKDINENIDNYIDFSVPWNLSMDYTLNYSTPGLEKEITQSIRLNGDLSLTEKWKIAFSTGYDFTNREITYTTLDIYRDLHCWEMSFNWVPFGYQKSYFFNIKVKAPILQDLKLTKRKSWFDY